MDDRLVESLTPVRRQALSDAVFEQLRSRILSGDLAAGAALPAERVLCEALGVNRSSVREALRRLEQARLVSVRHGGTSQVLDYRSSAGLDLLSSLLTDGDDFDTRVVRGVMEMRSAIAADAARLAATRADASVAPRLRAIVAAMRRAGGDLAGLQALAVEFWSAIIDASDNIAYRLAYNSLRETYDQCRALLAEALAGELRDVDRYAAIADGVAGGDTVATERMARELVRRGEESIASILQQLDEANAGRGSHR